MRMFWSIFFLGSLLLLTADVVERRRTPEPDLGLASYGAMGDPYAPPTPRP